MKAWLFIGAGAPLQLIERETPRPGPDGRSTTLAAMHVIAALPTRLLEATVAFNPTKEAAVVQRWRDTPTWMRVRRSG